MKKRIYTSSKSRYPYHKQCYSQKKDVWRSGTRCFWVTMPQTQTKHWGQTWSTIEVVCISIHTRWNFHWHDTSTKNDHRYRNPEPVSQKPYPITMKHYQWVKEEIEKLLTTKVIQGSPSSWSAPIIVVPKGDRGKCLVVDYWALNKVTRKFIWPMPKVEDISSQLNGASISPNWTFEQHTNIFL